MSGAEFEEILTTTRMVRRRLDYGRPVARELVRECLELALHAPNGGNRQDWRFLVIDDPAAKAGIAEHYRRASRAYLGNTPDDPGDPDDPEALAKRRNAASARVLADRLHEVPVLVLGCVRGRLPDDAPAARRSSRYGSVYPALWSLLLAARSRGLGGALTTVHLAYEREVAELLGIPYEEVTQVALVALGHLAGPPPAAASRRPLDEVVAWNRWDG